MHTDIPLKRLTALRGADLLALFGLPNATLVRVESPELPFGRSGSTMCCTCAVLAGRTTCSSLSGRATATCSCCGAW
ncbi:MAG: hypothetical protein HC884_06995 [Chloroflexaceae bacterium]|nr:hypothetical protein [Chloroflexaceae bacterium]